MLRPVLIVAFIFGLSACGLSKVRGDKDAMVLAKSQYCGTSSQDSTVRYFTNTASFERWINGRDIKGFDAALAASYGVIVIEMGQRPTGGYTIELVDTKVENETLQVAARWETPRRDAAVSQALIAPCIAIRPPVGEFSHVELLDQLGHVRGKTRVR